MNITIIIGPLCSGKTYFLNQIDDKDRKIDVGNIVRKIKNQELRVFEQHLDQNILNELYKEIQQAQLLNQNIYIAGIRQLSILISLEFYIQNLTSTYQRFFLNIDQQIRKERFNLRNSDKDVHLSFEEIEQKDDQLGLRELSNYCLNIDRDKTKVVFK